MPLVGEIRESSGFTSGYTYRAIRRKGRGFIAAALFAVSVLGNPASELRQLNWPRSDSICVTVNWACLAAIGVAVDAAPGHARQRRAAATTRRLLFGVLGGLIKEH